MNLFSQYTWIILILIIIYYIFKDYRHRKYINNKVRFANIVLLISTILMSAYMILNFLSIIELKNIFGCFFLINIAMLIYITYQYYVYESVVDKKQEYKKNSIKLSVVFIVLLLLVVGKMA